MTHSVVFASLGWAAVTMGFVGFYAQFRRANLLGTEGVSLATWTLFIYLGFFWIAYGFIAHSVEVSMGSIIVLPMQFLVLFRLRPWAYPRVMLQCLAFFAVCCVLPTMMWGWAGGVYGAGFAMVCNRGPQLIELLQKEDATGVSVWSWLFGAFCTALWILYYVGEHLWAALIATSLALVANLVIAALASWRHTQSRQRLIAAEVFVGA